MKHQDRNRLANQIEKSSIPDNIKYQLMALLDATLEDTKKQSPKGSQENQSEYNEENSATD